MEPVCIIPARSGSKGLPNKNMLFLDGKPMIFHTIHAAIESGCFKKENIFVSTDSEHYKKICETTGVSVLMRPKELATEFATSYQVNKHFLEPFPEDQVFVLLQVTSPLRTGRHIQEAFALYLNGEADHVVSFTKVDKSPTLFTTLDEGSYIKDSVGLGKNYRRQDEKLLYYPNGAIYISSKNAYLRDETYFSEKTQAYLMKKEDSVDVDDRFDFMAVIGRIYFDYQKREKKNSRFYAEKIEKLVHKQSQDNIILGDSRLLNLSLEGFDNLSIGGITLNTLLDNIDQLLTRKLHTVIISLGINDFIVGYDLETIEHNVDRLFNILNDHCQSLYVTTIAYSLFRDGVNNEDVKKINEFILDKTEKMGLYCIDLNETMAEEGHLKYEYTSDGIHYNESGQEVVNRMIGLSTCI
ncbi:cytidylyltransferase domain-containing protein [Streptococcus ruminantium]|uniref:cytidylyltransferase domain-containing protein n=1 Tax=Streptococcus ruminantium TaxID=1917441 RepID=UPI0012DBF088|nr:GDSL-type esterase/lipase family protein [Streptococcus ruminantium]MDQ8767890.1 GDSL-type esterase/lipase family protein [Streptococcus ruminantium]MDQ8780754.1 GDSL-type esterase/lipase family protein [Streptococcus ruminantium]BDD40549.1 N-acylneuraminate cytidylyltransferase [Streptococcus ruminantium]